jgi:hypothetical protein
MLAVSTVISMQSVDRDTFTMKPYRRSAATPRPVGSSGMDATADPTLLPPQLFR